MVLEKSVGIFAVPTVGGPTRRLNIYDLVRPRTKDAKKGFRVHRSRTNLDVIGLLNHAAVVSPVVLQLKDQVLKCGSL